MRKLGIIGGMSWVSTATYYDHINRIVQKRAAPMASAPLLIESLDFCQLYALVEEFAPKATVEAWMEFCVANSIPANPVLCGQVIDAQVVESTDGSCSTMSASDGLEMVIGT